MKPFKYKKSFKVVHWNCCFDSLLELKFAISIRQDYEFIHSRVSVYYDPSTKQPANYIRTCTKRYTPDFLIRHKQTLKAFWIEIKPRAFSDERQIKLRKLVAQKYIDWKHYDWEFMFVYDDEIHLNNEQQKLFDEYCRLKSWSHSKIKFPELNDRNDRSTPHLFFSPPASSIIEFVMFGTRVQTRRRR